MDNENQCLICLTKEIKDPIECNGCKKTFCLLCICEWKILYNECPQRCSKPWNIDLPIINIPKNGFVTCNKCKRIGSLLCRNNQCKHELPFKKEEYSNPAKCFECNNDLELYNTDLSLHSSCEESSSIFFFHCNICQGNYCDCILNI